MKPLDPRLLRYARGARTVLGLGGLFGVVRTIAVICWCWCISQAITVLVLPTLLTAIGDSGEGNRVAEAAYSERALPWLVLAALGALLVRSASGWAMDALAARGAVRVKAQLRKAALDALDSRSPDSLAGGADAGGATVLGRGLDALDGYFSGYLPQLILTCCATPLLVLAVLFTDPLSGVVVVIVFPVIPVFMVLVGLATRSVQEQQWQQLQHLSRSFLDVVEGLTTLKIFRREARQVQRITRETDEHRSRTMQVLRVTFLSGFVLDLAGTFSIALVAVTVGTRLVAGEFALAYGLFVLLLLPEAFIPIRAVGTAFHASTEGLAAAEQVFELIERPSQQHQKVSTTLEAGGRGAREIVFDAAEITRGAHTIGPVSFAVRPGEVVALVGPSGAGKSSLVSALIGFISLTKGSLLRPDTLAWAGQRPGLLQGSIGENVAIGDAEADPVLVRDALDAVGLARLSAALELGAQGAGLSGGQAQRVAIARALYRAWRHNAAAIVLDEPSSALDAASEARIAGVLRAEALTGRAVLMISHRPALVASADRVVRIGVAA